MIRTVTKYTFRSQLNMPFAPAVEKGTATLKVAKTRDLDSVVRKARIRHQ